MKPLVAQVLVLPPISHIALILEAEKPSSLHSNTTRLSSIRRFSEGVTSSAYLLSSAFCINSSKKWVLLLYRSLESLERGCGKEEGTKEWTKAYLSRARSSFPRSSGDGFEWLSSKPCCSRMLRMSSKASWAGIDMMEAK